GEERPVEEIEREERKTEHAVQKTRAGFFGRISEMFQADEPITEELWEELEELMIMADVGLDTTVDVIERVRRRVERSDIRRAGEARAILKQELVKLLQPETRAYLRRATRPYIILVVGVNGGGKTTLISKLANRYKNEVGQRVLLAAADTFRAAAVEQLQTWGERVGVEVIAQGQGADPGAVAFDAIQAAHARDVDVVIIDTAGRLQSKYNLMQELQKIRNVIRKRVESAPHEVLLVVDATTGQNGVAQAKAFMEAADVTHLAITKLDGTAKGGIAFAMVQEIKRPIRYIGTGEKVDDLAVFDPEAFVDALFDEEVPA
ncbi:MAG: signal recognition particle-docking protein FtsY, partial [Chloroflexota bacterium]|nr:signal recognition particle-docking protein FtsY [Chloroflexota bacterium]